MSVAITKWITRIGPGLKMCPNPLIKQEVIDVLRDFCTRTKLWHEQLDDIDIVADTGAYELTSDNGDVASIRRAEVSDVRIDPLSELTQDQDESGWRTRTGKVYGYYMGQDRYIHLVDTPADAVTNGLAVWVNLMPELTATTVQDFLFNDFRKVITLGAKASLLAHMDRPWSNPAAAEVYRGQYDAAVDKIKADSGKSMTPATRRQTLRARGNVITYF